MTETSRLLASLRLAWLPAVCIIAVGFLAWHAIAGDSGILALGGYRAEQDRLAVEAERTAAEKAALERRVALLAPSRVDPDLADELVRRNLGLVREDEFVITLEN